MSVFLNDDYELRPGWCFATYAMTYVVLFLATSAVMSELLPGPVDFGETAGLALGVLTFLPPAVLSLLFMLRFADRRPFAAFGVTPHEGWRRDAGLGLALSAGMTGVFLTGAALTGTWTWSPPAPGSVQAVVLTVILLSVAAANEELVYRGYPLQALIAAIGPSPAVVVMSALFGFGHLFNPNATWLGASNVFLAGVLLSVAYVRTRSLWLPWGIHLGWNLSTGVLLGLPVSGVRLNSVGRANLSAPDWITGGSFGPEGGILSTIAIITAAVLIGTTRKVRISPAVRAALSGKTAQP